MAAPDERPTVGIGMLGYNFMGKAHSNAFRTMPYMFWPHAARPKLVTVCGRREDKVAEAATRYGFDAYTTDWTDLLTDPAIDVFDNVGPDTQHFEPTLAAIAAGKHVVCEKPLAMSAPEAVQLYRAAAAADVRSLTCFNYRFIPAVQIAHEMISSGELGEIYTADFRYAQEWRTDPTAELPSPVGALSIIGCHAVDQARFLVGEFAAVSAVTASPVTTADRGEPIDSVTALAEFNNGATGTVAATLIAPGRRNRLGWEINGSKGSVCWDLENLNVLRVYRRGRSSVDGFADVIVGETGHPLVEPWWPSGHILGWEHSHINMLAEFVQAVADGRPLAPTAPTFADGAMAAIVADAITEAAAKGQRTTVGTLTDAS